MIVAFNSGWETRGGALPDQHYDVTRNPGTMRGGGAIVGRIISSLTVSERHLEMSLHVRLEAKPISIF